MLIGPIYARRPAVANAASEALRPPAARSVIARVGGPVIVPPIMTSETDEKAGEKAENQAEAPVAPAAEVLEAEVVDDGAGPKLKSVPPVGELKIDPQAEIARLRDQLLRTAADFDNFRKRARREQEDATRRGRETTIKDLLPIFDNLERATAHAESAADAKAVSDGLRMVTKQFVDTLDRMGIKRVATVGQPFDPSRHEAIQHLESKDHPAGTIVAEVQGGYLIGDFLVRPAMVVVSKGPPIQAN
ncbi:MAG: nucleotide exchange factor GrpE [Byssovorax sp.]